jgi:hypothetical protein
MTQPEQAQEPTLGDLVIAELEAQLAEPDPRYARKCRELAILRVQYRQLAQFVEENKEVLGLVSTDGQRESEAQEAALRASEADEQQAAESKAAEPKAAVNGVRLAPVPPAKTGK